MSCPGLHCPGCSGGQSLGIVAVAAAGLVLACEAVPWVAERIWWIGGTAVTCLVLSVAASMWLAGISERRGVAFAQAHGIRSRADVSLPARPAARQLPRRPAREVQGYSRQPGVQPARVVRVIPDHAVRVLAPARKELGR